ncbi:hypothetical protein AB0C12_35820 [Actinoplanes sp. NPDC048967]|uniref:hypothetical protein n=1 Tax=Actinoplanes sp. NPDC048967 TaxID=3155269 RepID=UPI0033F71D84
MKISTRILFTVIAGGLTYLLTNATGQPEIWQLTMSMFVGGIVLVVQVLIDYDNRMLQFAGEQSAHARRTEDIVDRRFAAISAATALYASVEATALKADNVTRLVESAARISPHDELSRRFADHQINRLSTLFEGLQNGVTVDDGEDPSWLLGLTECSSRSIDATSMTSFTRPAAYVDDEFWSSRLGQQYLHAQRRAITERDVRIRRVFLLSDEDAMNEERLRELREPHRRIGIETRVLRHSDLDPLLQMNLVDFILFDDAASYELHASSRLDSRLDREANVSVTLVVEPRRLQERRQRFASMWNAAREE